MKKITLLLALVCSMSMFATRYLVQPGTGGAATWRATEAGEILVDLTVAGQSFNAWYNGSSAVSGDEVWVISGTYVNTGVTTLKDGVSIYGSFAGTEVAVSERSKPVNASAWEFSNITVFDGNNISKGIANSVNFTTMTYVDGLHITKCTAGTGGGAEIMKNVTIRNCNIYNNVASGTTNDGGAGIRVKGGVVSNSYIHNNTTATGGAAGIGSNFTSLIENCLIEGNTVTGAGKGGGGIYVATSGGTVINNCIIKNNSAAGTGGGINVFFSSLQSGGVTVTNTQFIDNKALGTIGGAYNANANSTTPLLIEGCTFNGNTSVTYGGAVQVQSGALIIRKSYFANNIAGTTTLAAGSAVYGQFAFELSNSVIVNNSGTSTIYIKAANSKIYNNTIAQNTGSIAYFATADIAGEITNCIMTGNSSGIGFHGSTVSYPTISYSAFSGDISGLTYLGSGSVGNVISAETYISPVSIQGAETNSTDSLAIANANWQLLYNASVMNAGTTIATILTDQNGISRPQGASYDIGAYELPYYNTTVTFNAGGTVNSLTSGDILSEPKGKPLAFTITPDAGKKIKSVLYNAVEVKSEIVVGVYTAPALTANAMLAVEFEVDLSTATNDLQSKIQCFTSDGNIHLRGLIEGNALSVYSVTGAAIYHQAARSGEMTLSVNKGIYIVKVNGKVIKVVVE